jgi:hypothetical protein
MVDTEPTHARDGARPGNRDDQAAGDGAIVPGGATGGLAGGAAGNTGGGVASSGSSSDWSGAAADAAADDGQATPDVGLGPEAAEPAGRGSGERLAGGAPNRLGDANIGTRTLAAGVPRAG